MSNKKDRSKAGIEVNDAVTEVVELIEDAIDFQAEELEDDWALAERYYNGLTDLAEFEGRSNVTKTEVRDAVRNSLPSIMRTLLHSRKPVVYMPSSVQHAAWIDQQGEYATSLFYKNDGYMQLYYSIMEALKLKRGVLKCFWEPEPASTYFKITKIPFDQAMEIAEDPMVSVESIDRSDTTQLGDDIDAYDISGNRHYENGRIVLEYVPNYEFFMSGHCSTIEQALRQGAHGQRQIVTVDEALDMGLDYDGDWLELDADDPELDEHASSSYERRGYTKEEHSDDTSLDVLRHKFLLTEAYVSYDLKGTGRSQIYRFFLGGSSYKYIDHEEVEDSPFSTILPIPIPGSSVGHSLADLTITEQDTSTSLLRAIIDNAHAANDPRHAADPSKTSFEDLMNKAIGAPIRKRSGDTIQTVTVPFTGQGTLGVLQYLDQDTQNKVGVTKAAQGLDPDAMQSTDKNAVMNTIMTSQGQTELMVRNIVESGLIRVFRILMRLSIRHMEPRQLMVTKGKVIPVDTSVFDPDAVAVPNVGLGTASPMQRQAALTFILQKQEQMMQAFGPNNPFTSFSQIYNTLEDLLEANSVYNVERYFNIVTPEVEKQYAKARQAHQEKMAALEEKNRPMDPSVAYLQVEEGKRQVDALRETNKAQQHERKISVDAAKAAEEIDIKRDGQALERVVQLATVQQQQREADVKQEQEANDDKAKSISSAAGGGRAAFASRRRPKTSSGSTPAQSQGRDDGR